MSKKRSGFTLIEIMIVVVIIGLLAAMVGPRIAGKGEMAKKEAAKANVMTLATMVNMYQMKNNANPGDLVTALAEFGAAPTSPWGAAAGYSISGTYPAFTIEITPPGATAPIKYDSSTGAMTDK